MTNGPWAPSWAQVAAFFDGTPGFAAVSAEAAWNEVIGPGPPRPRTADGFTLTMTPARTATDGFLVAPLERTGRANHSVLDG